MIKQCSKCDLEKDLGAFHKNTKSKDGYQYNCKVCCKEYSQKPKIRLNQKQYSQRPEVKECRKQYSQKPEVKTKKKEYKQNNRDKINTLRIKYHACKLNRTPKWLTEQDHFEIELKYFEASEYKRITGLVMEVDHIIPLQGEFMSGLHVPWNLRVVTQTFNRSRPKNILPFEGTDPKD